ncbi:MAG: hypothetical protein KJI69_05090 [Patescibacteria group bacterium]|nr:hypothetical protein [Patescibacteria group bacterium]
MKNTPNIPEILNRIADIGSTNEKKRIVEETKSGYLKFIFKQAYDPFINYGTVKIDTSDVEYEQDVKIDRDWFEDLRDLLNKLENRELTGNAAKEEVKNFISHYPEAWGRVVLNILKKDLRIGAGKRLINKVYPKLFPEDICMSAMKYDTKRASFPVYADIKLDGIRCIADMSKKKLVSRNGKEFKNYPFILGELEQLTNEVTKIDGEIVMGHFQDLMRTLSRKDDGIELAKDAVYNIFDVIIDDTELSGRLHILDELQKEIDEKNLTHLKVIKGTEISTETELLDFYNKQLADGHEGVMVKKLDGLYEFKRSYSWMKMKPEESDDLTILRVEEGTGKYENLLGAIVCELPNGSEVNVGSGFKDDERKKYWDKKDELPGRIAEVKYQEKTKDGSLRFPVFIRFRPDK